MASSSVNVLAVDKEEIVVMGVIIFGSGFRVEATSAGSIFPRGTVNLDILGSSVKLTFVANLLRALSHIDLEIDGGVDGYPRALANSSIRASGVRVRTALGAPAVGEGGVGSAGGEGEGRQDRGVDGQVPESRPQVAGFHRVAHLLSSDDLGRLSRRVSDNTLGSSTFGGRQLTSSRGLNPAVALRDPGFIVGCVALSIDAVPASTSRGR